MRKTTGLLDSLQLKAFQTVIRLLEVNLYRDPITAGLAIRYLKEFMRTLEKER